MEKKITLENGDIIVYRKVFNGSDVALVIDKYYLENDVLAKAITIYMGNDFNFNAWIIDNSDGADKVDFRFDYSDPLFVPLMKLLGNDQSVVLDDDATFENKVNTMTISKDDGVVITFENKKQKLSILDKNNFNVFVRNVMVDSGSKIDRYQYDTKNRLRFFFTMINNIVCEDYHQITIDEYFEQQTLTKSKK